MMHLRLLSTLPRTSVLATTGSSSRRQNASISLASPAALAAAARLGMRSRAPVLLKQQQQQLVARRMFTSNSNSGASGPNSSEGFFKRAWTKYNTLLVTHPLTTKIVTGGTIAAIGDINCQVFLEPDKPFNLKRAAIFTFLGGVFISPILHMWYGFLGRVVPGTSSLAIAKRLALDQLVFAPTFLPIFFTALLTFEGDVSKVPEKLSEEWWPTVKANWYVWVPAQLINFRFVPSSLQVLFSNVIGLFWNSYLSFVSHTHAHAHTEAIEPESTPEIAAVAVPQPRLT